MIEVHVIHNPDTDPPLEGVMRLLREEPVRIRVYKALPGHQGLIRAKAVARAREPWVSWLHPTDRIEPGLYRVLREAITHDARLVHAWTRVGDRMVIAPQRGALIRRDAALPLLPGIEACDEGEDVGLLSLRPAVAVPWPGVTQWALEPGHTPE